MVYGLGQRRGFGRGGGRGIGFRGMSPPWPYVGSGRGGLPRCGYFFSGAGAPVPWSYTAPIYSTIPASPGYAPYSASITKEEELSYLKNQAEAIKKDLDRIDARMHDLEAGK